MDPMVVDSARCFLLVTDEGIDQGVCVCHFCAEQDIFPKIVSEAGVSAGVVAKAAESGKHEQNDTKCSELGWQCIPLAVETYRAWGEEACNAFSCIAMCEAILTKLQQIPSFEGPIWQTEHCACESKRQGYPCKILAGGRHTGRCNGLLIC